MPNVDSLLRDHVTLSVDCIDRIYLNGYVSRLQRPGHLWWYLHEHRGHPIVSPTLLKQITDAFVGDIRAFAQREAIPVVAFERGARKEDVFRKHLARFKGTEGVVFIGVAQEKATAFRAYQEGPRRRHRTPRGGHAPRFVFYRGTVDVNQYYFYLLDRDFGPCFIKFSSYAPFPVRVWLNGHEWAKRQLLRKGIAFEELDNGFLACDDAEALQRTCKILGAEHIEAFFRRWLRALPHPFTAQDRRAGFRYKLSIFQLEVSLTQVFDRPLHGRHFFEEVIRDNLDVGRPDRVQLLFGRRIIWRGRHPTPGSFRTRVVTDGVQPSLRFQYKHTRVKQYFKLDHALRTETTFNDTYDVGIGRSLHNLEHLRTMGHHINHRLLNLERVAQHCAIPASIVENVVTPTLCDDGQRAPALHWGDPRAMALLAAICGFSFAPEGFTNRQLRSRVATLHDPGPRGYTAGRMTYDLRRLRRKGILVRLEGTHRYQFTPMGRRIALFMTKSYARLVKPVLARLDPGIPEDANDRLRRAWRACERAFEEARIEANLAA